MDRRTITRLIVTGIWGVLTGSLLVTLAALGMSYGMSKFRTMDYSANWTETEKKVNFGVVAAIIVMFVLLLLKVALAVFLWQAYCAAAIGWLVSLVIEYVWTKSTSGK
jgi:hypothetical protein